MPAGNSVFSGRPCPASCLLLPTSTPLHSTAFWQSDSTPGYGPKFSVIRSALPTNLPCTLPQYTTTPLCLASVLPGNLRTAPLCRTRTTKNLGQIPTCRIRGAADAWCRTRGPQAKQDPGHYDRDYFELRKCHDWATLYFKWGVGISGMNGITGCPNLMMLPNTSAKYCHTSVSLKTQGNFGDPAKKIT